MADTFSFGSGNIWATQLTDYTGATVSLPTPFLIGTMQDASVDFASDNKGLYGQNKFPVAMGQGKAKISGKMKFARLDGLLFQSIVAGQSITSGIAGIVYDTTGAAIPGTPFQITPTPPSSGTFGRALAVRAGDGTPYTQVASAPAAGQFSLSAGVFLFNTADTGKTVFIDYSYTATSTVSKKVLVGNTAMGLAPTFKVDFLNPRAGATLTLYAAMISKFAYATKLDDWAINEIDFEAFADGNGNVYQWGLPA